MKNQNINTLWNRYTADRDKRMAIQFSLMTLNAECETLLYECKRKVAEMPD